MITYTVREARYRDTASSRWKSFPRSIWILWLEDLTTSTFFRKSDIYKVILSICSPQFSIWDCLKEPLRNLAGYKGPCSIIWKTLYSMRISLSPVNSKIHLYLKIKSKKIIKWVISWKFKRKNIPYPGPIHPLRIHSWLKN